MCPWPVGFSDADFPHAFFNVTSSDGRIERRWLPFGMPRLNPVLPRSVFFLYGVNPKTGKYGGPWGTGAIIGIPREEGRPYLAHYYAVTCQHVLGAGGHDIRLNTKDGAARPIKIDPDQWEPSPSGDDLAAVDITDRISLGNDDISAIPWHILLSEEFAGEVEIDAGEDGFMLGLFADMPGKHQNLIAARFGNLSLFADKHNPAPQGNRRERPSHIFDMHSRPGYSGSPVFIYRTPTADLRNITYGPDFMAEGLIESPFIQTGEFDAEKIYSFVMREQTVKENMFLRLLGIHSAVYPDTVDVTAIQKGGKPGRRSKMKIPNSLAVVIPSWEVERLLMKLPKFIAQRRAREATEAFSNTNMPEPQSSDEESEPPTRDGDERSRERFTSLLGAAAKKKPQAD